MSFIDENERFEACLTTMPRGRGRPEACEHKKMSRNSFWFLRATFFRWSSPVEETAGPERRSDRACRRRRPCRELRAQAHDDEAPAHAGASMISMMLRIFPTYSTSCGWRPACS